MSVYHCPSNCETMRCVVCSNSSTVRRLSSVNISSSPFNKWIPDAWWSTAPFVICKWLSPVSEPLVPFEHYRTATLSLVVADSSIISIVCVGCVAQSNAKLYHGPCSDVACWRHFVWRCFPMADVFVLLRHNEHYVCLEILPKGRQDVYTESTVFSRNLEEHMRI